MPVLYTPSRLSLFDGSAYLLRLPEMRRLVFLALIFATGCAGGATVRQTGSRIITDSAVPLATAPTARVVEPPRDTIRPLATLDRGWNRIPGREGTGCAHDSTFVFRVRPGLPDKVLIYLNGGGACWRAQDCDPQARPTYTMNVDSANDASVRQGIFDVSNEKNPVRDFTMVFVPYCTGDMHLGARTVDYETRDTRPLATPRAFSVKHMGAENLDAVLDWVYANVSAPRIVFVAGSSTGAVATPVIAAQVARHYARARVVQLGDAAGGLRADSVPQILARWGAMDHLWQDAAFRNVDSSAFTFDRLYVSAARSAPRVRFAQYNTVDDATQLALLTQLGVKATPVARLLVRNLTQVRDATPWFRSYTAPGRTHAILRSNAMYTTTVGGVRFSDWLASLVNGTPVSDVGSALLTARKPTP